VKREGPRHARTSTLCCCDLYLVRTACASEICVQPQHWACGALSSQAGDWWWGTLCECAARDHVQELHAGTRAYGVIRFNSLCSFGIAVGTRPAPNSTRTCLTPVPVEEDANAESHRLRDSSGSSAGLPLGSSKKTHREGLRPGCTDVSIGPTPKASATKSVHPCARVLPYARAPESACPSITLAPISASARPLSGRAAARGPARRLRRLEGSARCGTVQSEASAPGADTVARTARQPPIGN